MRRVVYILFLISLSALNVIQAQTDTMYITYDSVYLEFDIRQLESREKGDKSHMSTFSNLDIRGLIESNSFFEILFV